MGVVNSVSMRLDSLHLTGKLELHMFNLMLKSVINLVVVVVVVPLRGLTHARLN